MLNEALDERTPLLERVKFLAILSRRSPASGSGRVRSTVVSMLDEQAACYRDVVRPRLGGYGVRLVTWDDLTEEQREEASRVFVCSSGSVRSQTTR